VELSGAAQSWVDLVLLWIGFGTVVGLVANLFLPAGQPNSFFGNLTIGTAGSCAGPSVFVLIVKPEHFHPISPVGFVLAVVSAVLLTLVCRIAFFAAQKIRGKKGE
jgi:uncharacterized membrane protein YeaQ/YmgE (transglycosylase-associated protein family)